MNQRAKRRFRIEDNHRDQSGEAPLVLIGDDDQVVAVHSSSRVLADMGFASGADEVRHNEDLVAREGSR